MSFEILKKSSVSRARLGVIHTAHGDIHTPAFMPIGTYGAVRSLSPEEVRGLGAEVILSNTYHLWLAGDEIIKKAGGLHKFMNWDGPIMTDSGGYQLFSLGEKIINSKIQMPNDKPIQSKITEDGVAFRDSIVGDEHLLTPEKSVEIQHNLGSDITVVLDEFTGDINNYEKVKATVERTTRWAQRARKAFSGGTAQLQYAVIQGGMFPDLRKQSAMELSQLDFDGYCIGGVAVGGESSQEQYKAVEMSVPYLPEDKPRHLLGVGTPDQIVEAVKRNTDYKFLDAIARMAAAALANKSQREGAARVLTLEQLCGIALKYVAPSLRSNDLYPAVSGIFKKAAEKEQYRPEVFKVLNWATGKDELAMNAAFLLSTLADKYGWDVGTKSNTATQQLFAAD